MASINNIELRNSYSSSKQKSKNLLAGEIYIDNVFGGILDNNEIKLKNDEILVEILFRCKDYLLHGELFSHDVEIVSNYIDESRYEKLIKLVLDDLSILNDLEFIYSEKLHKGEMILRAKLGDVQHVFNDISHFNITTSSYLERLLKENNKSKQRGNYR